MVFAAILAGCLSFSQLGPSYRVALLRHVVLLWAQLPIELDYCRGRAIEFTCLASHTTAQSKI